MKSYESTGRTIEEAISSGLKTLGAAIGDVSVDILEEGSKGLFGLFGSKQAKVRLTMKEEEEASDTRDLFKDALEEKPAEQKRAQKPQLKPALKIEKAEKPETIEKTDKAEKPETTEKTGRVEKPAPKPQQRPAPVRAHKPAAPAVSTEPPAPAPQMEPGTCEGKAQEFLQDVTRLMNVNVSVFVKRDEEGNIRVNMQGDTLGILIGRRGETLDSLQYLTSLYVNRGQNEYTRVTLDTEGYREKREEALVRLANRMANRAQKTGRRVSMEPMNPYERRILHSALQNHPAVTTHSEGEEPNRHVVITLK